MNARIEKLEQFLAATPEDPFLNHALALEWIKEGDEEKARTLFETTRFKNPTYVATYYHLGKLLERAGDEEGAITVFAEGMTIAKAAGDGHSFSELRSAHDELAY